MNDQPEYVLQLQRDAPGKPLLGSPCNGCGACCAFEPCPVSRLFLGHRAGGCPALVWDASARRYQCGMVINPSAQLGWLPKRLDAPAGRVFRRWVAVGVGCDFDAEII